MARLIRTEKEVEGRWTEQWIVVEEDVLEQWPDGPLEVVGRPAPRIDGLARARGEALYTADIVLPGMLHAAILRSPHAHARLTRIDADGALAAPGVRAVLLPRPPRGRLDLAVLRVGAVPDDEVVADAVPALLLVHRVEERGASALGRRVVDHDRIPLPVRVDVPHVRQPGPDGGTMGPADWEVALAAAAKTLSGKRAYVLASPTLSNEALYLLSRLVKKTSGTGVFRVPQGDEAPLPGAEDLSLRRDRAANANGAELLGFTRSDTPLSGMKAARARKPVSMFPATKSGCSRIRSWSGIEV